MKFFKRVPKREKLRTAMPMNTIESFRNILAGNMNMSMGSLVIFIKCFSMARLICLPVWRGEKTVPK